MVKTSLFLVDLSYKTHVKPPWMVKKPYKSWDKPPSSTGDSDFATIHHCLVEHPPACHA